MSKGVEVKEGEIVVVGDKSYMATEEGLKEIGTYDMWRPIPIKEAEYSEVYIAGTLHQSGDGLDDKKAYKAFCVELQEFMEKYRVSRLDIHIEPYRRDNILKYRKG